VRQALEVADIFRRHGPAWRATHAGHVSLAQLKAMSAIETCRTAALGGHLEGCEGCGHRRIAYNSCIMGRFSNGELVSSSSWNSRRFSVMALLCSFSCPHKSGSPRRYGWFGYQ